MPSVLSSIDQMIANAENYGMFRRFVAQFDTGGVTSANSTSGFVIGRRWPSTVIIPTITSPCTGVYFSYMKAHGNHTGFNNMIVGVLEYDLGSINMSTGTFSDGVAMPTKNIMGSSIQSATQLLVLEVSAAVTATTPLITITYTDQDGNTGNTATLTLPTNPALNSVFLCNPYLASGDSGVQDITNITKSAGTAGTIHAYGLLILNVMKTGSVAGAQGLDQLTLPRVPWIATQGETVAIYEFGGNNAVNSMLAVAMAGVAET